MNMDDRTVPKTRTGPNSVRGLDFRSGFVGPVHDLNFENFQNRRFEIQSGFFYLFENTKIRYKDPTVPNWSIRLGS